VLIGVLIVTDIMFRCHVCYVVIRTDVMIRYYICNVVIGTDIMFRYYICSVLTGMLTVLLRLDIMVLECVDVCCSVLQRVAVCCSVLQCVDSAIAFKYYGFRVC